MTGASGFIGHAVCALLLECGADVWGSVRSRPPPAGVKALPARLPEDAAALLAQAAPAVVIHTASPIDLGRDPSLYSTLRPGILDATAAVAAACLTARARLVVLGTCAEYGDGQVPLSESHPPRPLSPYAALKTAATHWVLAAARTAGLQATVVRPFRTFGPRDRSSVIHLACRAALRGEALALTDGAQVREWNAVRAIATGILCAAAHPGAIGEVINLGGGTIASVREMVEAVFSLAGADPAHLHFGAIPRRQGELQRFYGDHSLSHSLWGPLPHPPLQQALEDTLEWLRAEAAD